MMPVQLTVDGQKWQGDKGPRLPVVWLLLLTCVALAAACGEADKEPAKPAQEVVFTDITAASGIQFKHTNGSSGRKYVVETMGSGAAALDYDGDGNMDLYVVDSGILPGASPVESTGNLLLRNAGPGGAWAFHDQASAAAVDDQGYGMGVTVGDFDNDQDPDLLVTNVGVNRLFRNEANSHDNEQSQSIRFTDISSSSDVGLDSSWSTGAAFSDIDLDGDLDLYVANYLEFSFPPADSALGRPRRHVAPTEYPGRRDFLYRNDGDGDFVDVTEAAGLSTLEGRQLGVVFVDIDDDGDADLFQGNDATPNGLFRNNGDGSFVEVGLLAGVAFNGSGQPEGTMGVDAADVDGDGLQDLVMTNFQWESNTLYRAVGPGTFDDASRASGIGGPSFDRLAFGINFLDVDNDGDQDLFVANGHIDEDISRFDPQASYGQANQLLLNDGDGRFQDVSTTVGIAFEAALVSRGSVAFDYDNDGDQDLFIVNSGQRARLLRNDTATQNHWLELQLRGRDSNTDGFGARVAIYCGQKKWMQEHRSGVSYLSQDDPRLHFGLGLCAQADSVAVHWPSGTHQTLVHVKADRAHLVREPVRAEAASTARAPSVVTADAPEVSDSLGIEEAWAKAPMVLPRELGASRQVPHLDSTRLAYEASQRHTDGTVTVIEYAEALRLHRHYEAAESMYSAALPEHRAEAHLGLGQLQMSRGNMMEALAHYKEAITADDKLADAHYFHGNLLVRQSELDSAAAAYGRALDRDELHLRSYVNLASVHARQTDYGPAVETLHRALRALPGAAEVQLQLARILFVQTRYEEAAEQLTALIDAGAEDAETFALLARIDTDLGFRARALSWLRQGLQQAPDDARLRARLGVALVDEDSLRAALPHLTRAVELDADGEEARYHLGRLYLQLGMQASGEVSLRYFQSLQTHHTDMLDFKTAIVLNPDDARAYYALGAVYSRIGRLQAASQAYRVALRINPSHVDALNNLGNIHLRRREVQPALGVFRRLLALDSTYVRGHNNLGNAWMLAGDLQRAATSFQKALQLDPGYEPAHTALTRIRSASAGSRR